MTVGSPAMAAKTRKAPDCSQEYSERNTKLAAAPAANRTAMAAEEADALMLMENISEHSTQNTAAACNTNTVIPQTRQSSLSIQTSGAPEEVCPTMLWPAQIWIELQNQGPGNFSS